MHMKGGEPMAQTGQWDAYLNVEDLKGEVTRTGHTEEIKLRSFSFGASNPGEVTTAKAATSIGAASIHKFMVEKTTDAASPIMRTGRRPIRRQPTFRSSPTGSSFSCRPTP